VLELNVTIEPPWEL